jgi:Ca2+-binding RTX toxin-like protein
MSVATATVTTRFLLAFACCLAATVALTVIAAPAQAASAPKCRGLKATIWTKDDAIATIRGTARADVIVTGESDDLIRGFGGRDIVCSKGGKDKVFGGPGSDRIYAGTGDDFVSGSYGSDVLCTYGGRDAAFGGEGDDWISVGAGVNFYDADGDGTLDDPTYLQWIAEGFTYTVGIGSGKDDVMTGNMVHVKGAKLAKRWHC